MTKKDNVHLSRRAHIAVLVANEASTSISTQFSDFLNVVSPELALESFEHTGINIHTIALIDDCQPTYKSIYSLGLVELKILKTYIKTNLANGFIRLSKSPEEAFILFDKKLDENFQLCIDY